MGVRINMQNELIGGTPLDDTFDDALREFNQAASEGHLFLTMRKLDGNRKAFFIPNVNTIDETEEDELA